jgi:hypothetical protein
LAHGAKKDAATEKTSDGARRTTTPFAGRFHRLWSGGRFRGYLLSSLPNLFTQSQPPRIAH